jgi:dTDP-4-amino-4,6-dideoxygalactose transaminase
MRRARLHGMSSDAWRRYLPGGSWRYSVEAPGLKANMTDLQAAIGREQLTHLAGWQARRRALADRYDRGLATLPALALPARPADGGHAWHLYAVRVLTQDRDVLIDQLTRARIGTSVHFTPLHHMPYFRAMCADPEALGTADLVASQLLSLPLHPALTDGQVDRVCDVLGTHLAASAISRSTPRPRSSS